MTTIQIFYRDVRPFGIKKSFIKRQVSRLILSELKEIGEISVIFCSDEYLLKINKQYLDHDYYTDVITFDYVLGSVISGDIFISADRIEENSKLFGTVFINELFRVIFHGVLHLCGYNDKSGFDIEQMRGKEDYYLSGVDFGGVEV